jgi:hypothetical protein
VSRERARYPAGVSDEHAKSLERARELLRGAERALLAADADAAARRALAHTGHSHGQTGVEWVGRTAAIVADAARHVERELSLGERAR